MAIAYVTQGNNWQNTFQSTISCTLTTSGTNRALIALVILDSTSGTTIDSCAISGGGASFTAAAATFGQTPCFARGFYLTGDANVPSGSITVVGTCSNNGHKPAILVVQYSGVNTITGRSSGSAGDRTPTLSVTSSSGNTASHLGIINYDANYTLAQTSPSTSRLTASGSQPLALPSNFMYGYLLDRDGGGSTVAGSISGGATPTWAGQGFDLAPASTVTTTKYYSGSDISAGNWTKSTGGGTNLYTMVDETTADDADYIQSGQNPVADIVEVKFAGVGVPGSNQGAHLRYHLKSDGTCPSIVYLYCGTTLIASWSHDGTGAEAGAFAAFDRTLSTTDVDNIIGSTDPTDMRIRVKAN